MATLPDYAELHCLSNYSFLRGASHVEELVERARELGYSALAITEECSLASAPRAHLAGKAAGLPIIHGAELQLEDGPKIVLLAADGVGYAALSRLITRARQRAAKGQYCARLADLEGLRGCLAILLPGLSLSDDWLAGAQGCVAGLGGDAVWLGVELLREGDDEQRLRCLQAWGEALGLPLVACGDVHMHRRSRRALQDVLTAVRRQCTLAEAGFQLAANGERHLRARAVLASLYPAILLQESHALAQRCHFTLDSLRYRYPDGDCPAGMARDDHLAQLAQEGLQRRYPQTLPVPVRQQLRRELELVRELDYASYFLTVHDIVAFAKARGILCQGRGSAANSVLCYALGITEVDPARMNLLFERFLSRERHEPPDIDVDFEHDRREEVIQYVFQRYGREHAALTATVIHYRPRSAMRDAARALGFTAAEVARLCKGLAWWDGRKVRPERLQEAGFDPEAPALQRLMGVVNALVGFPRHLSQHVGGMVLSATPLPDLVPVEPAAMAGRTVLQWDKDDLDALGILKVDILALGMLSALRRALTEIHMSLADIPAEDPQVYAMLQRGDSLGVFQVESRAQIAMLPRLKPRTFYDLVIEVAIVRPGPIQGDMVHPYLRRRQGLEPISYPGPEVEKILQRTLGVPIFQEQVMQIAMQAAGFSGDEADGLRRAMAAWRRHGNLGPYADKLIAGLLARGYAVAFAERLCQQIQGFAEYGFPESHAASFALLVYASAWIKCHHPAVFAAALLNSQPMGFYAPAQIVQDARRHGVSILPVDVRHSHAESHVENGALRLGLGMIKGFPAAAMERLLQWRERYQNFSLQELLQEAGLDRELLQILARAGALHAMAGDRHRALWAVQGVTPPTPLALDYSEPVRDGVSLPAESPAQACVADYTQLGLSLGPHPLAFLRRRLEREGYRSVSHLRQARAQSRQALAGLVINRQRPGTAKGTIFLTLEDETGMLNVIVWGDLVEAHRRVLLQAQLLGVRGTLEREGEVVHLIVGQLRDLSPWLGRLTLSSRDFH